MGSSTDIASLNARLGDFDTQLMNRDPHSPALQVSAIARASYNYWYANIPSASMLHINLLDLAMLTSCTLDEPCKVNRNAVYKADYIAGAVAYWPSAVGCTATGFAYVLCVGGLTGASAGAASVAEYIWEAYVSGDDGGGGGNDGQNSGCGSGAYLTWSRGSPHCTKYTV